MTHRILIHVNQNYFNAVLLTLILILILLILISYCPSHTVRRRVLVSRRGLPSVMAIGRTDQSEQR